MTTRDLKITLIGIGLMGSRMARRLLEAGYPLTIRDPNAENCKPLVALGAKAAESAAEAVAEADVVITMLAGAKVIDMVYFGDDGVSPNAPKDALLIDMSSLAPDLAIDLHKRLSEAGYDHHLDAPVSGGISGAEAGTLSIMVGGPLAELEKARPVFEVLGNVFHLGDDGAGQVCKMVNQTIVHVTIGAVTEGLILAASLGVDAGKVREAISGGYCQSRILEIHGEKMVDRDFVPGGPLEFSVKDLSQADTMAKSVSLDLPLTQTVLKQYEDLVTAGKGRLDHSALLLAYEQANEPHQVSPGKADKLP
ncbi:NAD(P)-dependent oxidoreductase [Magnetospira sp. QH-2]|uniref:NAD(P)-dependent oxidoreductase n=1 Tax=Magnetospira sp. (strain QH-2) TaxID=1288970 RepID=UPI0003E81398|nr:NAD(P)-dependent oxidoreductase [Magnetospira sp. QH-2]CCQ74469.1 2-hydroxy-3-oxopropionate reductase [Magnetospira sp. QH-2]